MLYKPSQFLSSEKLNEPKSFDVALNIAGVEKLRSETCDCGQPGVFNGKERNGGNLCPL